MTPFIAFSAAATEEKLYATGDVIQFPHMFSSQGTPGYNPATGLFTCPADGHYMFTVTIYRRYSSNFYNFVAYVCKTGASRLTRLVNWMDPGNQWSDWSSGVSLIIPCRQMEAVWVEADSGRLYDSDSHYNTFSGLLLHEGLDD